MTDPVIPQTTETTMDRLLIKAEIRAGKINEIARILWENGEMLADCEDGSLPTWEGLLAHLQVGGADYDACFGYWRDHTNRAQALLDLDAKSTMLLGQMLIESARHKFEEAELDLWRKVERAKGFEPGSLTGKPGVKQRVAL